MNAAIRTEGDSVIVDNAFGISESDFSGLNSSISKIVYTVDPIRQGEPIIFFRIKETDAKSMLNLNRDIKIISYTDESDGKDEPYIRLANGRFLGRNFAVKNSINYTIWVERSTNITLNISR